MRDDLADLVAAARGGDRAALCGLLEAVWPDAYRIAWSVLHDRHEAEDAAQEACVRLAQRLPQLRELGAFRLWLYRLTVRAALDRLRARRREVPVEPGMRGSGQGTVIEDIDADRVDLAEAIRALPPAARLLLVLRYGHDLPVADVARILGVPAPTVRSRLWSLRKRPRAVLGEEGPSRTVPGPTPGPSAGVS